jgi:hypothetical protein
MSPIGGQFIVFQGRCEPIYKRAAKGYWLMLLIPSPAGAQQSKVQKAVSSFESYLNMAGSQTAKDFRPLSQHERTVLYAQCLVNRWGFLKAAASGGIDQLHNKPQEWGQGWGAYGERVANIEGQYLTQKTITYLISSPLHEDNRYFGSGKHGVWPRLKYADSKPTSGASRYWKTLYLGFTTERRSGRSFCGALMASAESKRRR